MTASRWSLSPSRSSSLLRRPARPDRVAVAPRLEALEDRCLLSAAALSQLPLTFEANVGQADPAVRYLAHGAGYNLALTDAGAALTLSHSGSQDVVRLQLVDGAASPAVVGLDE
jgi:hypothetical protein